MSNEFIIFINYKYLFFVSFYTKLQVDKAQTVKVTGVAGAYTRSFEDMETKLQEVRDILRSASISNDELIGKTVPALK